MDRATCYEKRTTPTSYTYTDERESGGSKLIASRATGMVLFCYIFYFTILIIILRIKYTYAWRRQEKQGASQMMPYAYTDERGLETRRVSRSRYGFLFYFIIYYTNKYFKD
jgi:hypothetical protein